MTDQPRPAAGHSLPIFGSLFRMLMTKGVTRIYLITALAVVLWGAAIATFGLPGLFMPAVVATPIMLVILLFISRG